MQCLHGVEGMPYICLYVDASDRQLLKRRANETTHDWDDVTYDAALARQMKSVAEQVHKENPCRGVWCVPGDRAIVWYKGCCGDGTK